MDYSERRGSFVVGAYPDLVMHHLPPGIQVYRNSYPDVRIQLMARPYTPLLRLVKSGEIDLAFCAPPPIDDASLEFRELFKFDIVLMTPLNHPLLQRTNIMLSDLSPWPLILSGPESPTRQKVEQELRDRGVVRLDHVFESSVIGICTLKGKFLGQAVRNFIDVLSDEMRGFHANLVGCDITEVGSQAKVKAN